MFMKRICRRLALAALLALAPLSSIQADVFTFAGFTFDQRYAPTSGSLLGNGVQLGGAQFSSLLPNEYTKTLNFPQAPGFDSSKALAHLCGLASGTRGINLPRGNNSSGTATNRHGIQVTWNNGRVLTNLEGDDFVVYESGSNNTGVEGIMARARINADPETWTDWYYFAPVDYQVTTAPEVLFTFAFDLSKMGVPENGTVDRIQIANLTVNDRIDTLTPLDLGGVLVGEGRVVFDTSASEVLPDAGEFDPDRRYGNDSFDPDPVYIAPLHPVCENVAPYLNVNVVNNNLVLSWPAPSCFILESSESLSDDWNVVAEVPATVGGYNQVVIPADAPARFFRLVK